MKRFVGIEIDGTVAKIAIIDQEKDQFVLRSVEKHPLPESGVLSDDLAVELGLAEDRIGTSIAALLPASAGFIRTLNLPFSDEKRVATILPMELSTLIPPTEKEMIFDYATPKDADGTFTMPAVAVPRDTIVACIEQFGDILQPMIIDLAPFAFQSEMAKTANAKILIYFRTHETLIALFKDGLTTSHRVLLHAKESISTAELQREIMLLERSNNEENTPIVMIGEKADDFTDTDFGNDREITTPDFSIGQKQISATYIPAILLAYRATERKQKGINLRQGDLAFKNEWSALRRRAIISGVLVLASLIMVATGAWLSISRRADIVDNLNAKKNEIYRELFPGSPIVDVSLQMQGAITSLNNRLRILGGGDRQDAIDALYTISAAVPTDTQIDIRDFTYNTDGVRLEGSADSFDSVNKMGKAIEGAKSIESITIEDAKTSPAGDRVDFSMKITMKKNERDTGGKE